MLYPTGGKSADEAAQSVADCQGNKKTESIKLMYTDNAPQSIAAVSRLKLKHDTSTPHRSTVGFHDFNLRIYNLRVSNPSKLVVDVFLTRCRISMCQGPGPNPKKG